MSVLAAINKIIKEKGKAQTIPDLLLTDLEIKTITPEIAGVLEKCKKVEVLEMSSCRLESLDGLPAMPALTCVDFADNRY